MVVNETMTKVMCFGKQLNPNVYFNGKSIKLVETYEYLGILYVLSTDVIKIYLQIIINI